MKKLFILVLRVFNEHVGQDSRKWDGESRNLKPIPADIRFAWQADIGDRRN